MKKTTLVIITAVISLILGSVIGYTAGYMNGNKNISTKKSDIKSDTKKDSSSELPTTKKMAPVDFNNTADFESALNNGQDLTGKTVKISVDTLDPQSAYGYNIETGEHLNFVSSQNPNISEGDTLTVKATKIESTLGSWIINYDKVN